MLIYGFNDRAVFLFSAKKNSQFEVQGSVKLCCSSRFENGLNHNGLPLFFLKKIPGTHFNYSPVRLTSYPFIEVFVQFNCLSKNNKSIALAITLNRASAKIRK